MKASYSKFFALVAIAAGLLTGSVAHAIALTPASAALAAGDNTSQNEINNLIGGYVGDFEILYKATPGGNDDGDFAGFYTTSYPVLSPAAALITYDGAPDPYINTNPVFILLKGGKESPAWYLFDISGWDGKEDISFSGFYNGNQGKISHISIYGGESTTTEVPEGGLTLVLLGLGLAGASFVARRKA